MRNYDVCHVCADGEVGVAEQRYRLGELVHQFAGYEYAFSGTDGVRGKELLAVSRDVLFNGRAGFDLLCDVHAAGMKIAESWIVHVSVN